MSTGPAKAGGVRVPDDIPLEDRLRGVGTAIPSPPGKPSPKPGVYDPAQIGFQRR